MAIHTDLTTALAEARTAVTALPAGRLPTIPTLAGWERTGRHELLSWLQDIERCAMRGVRALERAEAEPKSENGATSLEEALWRADATMDKLVAFLGLAFGTGVLRRSRHGAGVEFDKTGDIWKRFVKYVTETFPQEVAGVALIEHARKLNEHSARRLRNEMAHLLSQIPDGAAGVQPLCSLEVIYQGPDTDESREWRQLYRSDAWGERSITVDAVWAKVVTMCSDAYVILSSLLRSVAGLLESRGRLHPPQVVRYDRKVHKAVLDAPPGRVSERLHQGTGSSV